MSEVEQLQQAIAALEAQRAALGTAVVEAGLAPMRERLAALQASAGVSLPALEQRKQTTVLFADMAGFTAMAEKMDPEDVRDILNAYFNWLAEILTRHGGRVEKFIGDAVLAVFGVPTARESDPEKAIQAALAFQQALPRLNEKLARRYAVRLAMRVGIHSGPVVFSFLGGKDGEHLTIIGDTVNVAARLQQIAPVGGVLISHDTYRLVRGVFDVEPQEPIAVKGKFQPLQTYIVLRAKPRAFRLVPHSVEGIETRTIGREAELAALQDAFRTITAGTTCLVTIVGEAGVGKSRLLYEFENWLELLPERILYFKGRATPEMASSPYGLFRDLFRHRFDILESDTTAAVRAKFEAGMGDHLPAEQAYLAGHLVGFDFSATPAVRNLLGRPAFVSLALANLLNYFRRLTQDQATVISLEDLHWADNPSLDLVARLGRELPNQRLLIVGLARPSLYERRAEWSTGPISPPLVLPGIDQGRGGAERHLRLELRPLSSADTRILIGEILQKVPDLPENLCGVVARRAEGNPFYVEELIKMLIEDGVIVPGEENWRVESARLQDLHVPPTLIKVLQARLDSLPAEEKELLQRAAVVGRLFWDATVAELHAAGDRVLEIGPVLEALQARELVFRRGHSAFAGAQEYTFKHALLRDVAYETVLRRLRRVYHRQVATWLASHGGERLNEYAGLIAEHYERAGKKEQAVTWLRRAGQLAYQTSAYAEAITAWERALPLLPTGDRASRARLLVQMGEAFEKTSGYRATREQLQAGLALAREAGDLKTAADALSGLSRATMQQGEFAEARRLGEEALALAQQAGAQASAALARRRLGALFYYLGDWASARQHTTASLTLYQEVGDREGIAACLNNLGLVLMHQGDYPAARRYLTDSLAGDRELGDRWGAAVCLTNLGWLLHLQGDYEGAVRYARESLAIHQEIGRRDGAARSRFVLGVALADLGDDHPAWSHISAALGEALALGAVPLALYTLTGIAQLQARGGRPTRAAELLGLALGHPATDSEVAAAGEPVLAGLRVVLPADELAAALERGKTLDLEAAGQEVLAGESGL